MFSLIGIPLRFALISVISGATAGPLQYHQGQEVLAEGDVTAYDRAHVALTQHVVGWFNNINITVGTPPQLFQTVVDIGQTDLLVPSTACNNTWGIGYCGHAPNLYNSSASSTNQIDRGPNARAEEGHYALRWSGVKNSDVVSIGDISLPEQSFLNADSVNEIGFLAPSSYNAVIGFPRQPDKCRREDRYGNLCEPGPFHSMIQDNVLDRNLFALRYSNFSEEGDSSGSLDLGFVNGSAYTGDLVTMPISEVPELIERTLLPSGWHVEFSKLSFGENTYSFPNFHAVFISIEPFIYVPMGVWRTIRDALFIPRDQPFGFWLVVQCNRTHELPDFHFTLGPDKTVITLTPQQYVVEMVAPGGDADAEHVCGAPFVPIRDGVLPPWPTGGAIVLGNTFLRAFYSVFDLDDNTISLGQLA